MGTEDDVKALVNTLLGEEDINACIGLLVRVRQLQPIGRLPSGYGYVVGRENPQVFYEQRRELIRERFELGDRDGIPPKISALAEEFECSTSTVFEIKEKYVNERDAA